MTTETTAQAGSRPQRKGPFRLTGEGWTYLLVPLIPAAVVLEFMRAGRRGCSWPPRAGRHPDRGVDGRATEELAARSGPGIGGFLTVTFGNARS